MLSPPAKTPTANLAQWTEEGELLFTRARQTAWDIAAWMEFGVKEFGDSAQRIALEEFGKSKAELTAALDLAKRFPADQRRPELTFMHHKLVAKLESEIADELLDRAVSDRLSIGAMKKAVAAIRESEGGDVFRQMASVNHDALVDKWTGDIRRLFNRAPSQEARDAFAEMMAASDNKLILT